MDFDKDRYGHLNYLRSGLKFISMNQKGNFLYNKGYSKPL